jgi:hypothetical protein
MTTVTSKYRAILSETGVSVTFVPALPSNVRHEPARFTCDFNTFGRLMGIETLDLVKPKDVDVLSALNKETSSLQEQGEVTYDEKQEVFYLRLNDMPQSLAEKIEQNLAKGRGLDQKSCDGFLLLDTRRRLLGLEVRF